MAFQETLIDAALITYLTSSLGLTVWAGYVPQTEVNYPQAVYTMIYQDPYYTTTHAAGLVNAEFQIDIYGTDALSVENLVENLRVSLEGYRGLMGTVMVTSCRYIDSSQLDLSPPDGSDSFVYRTMTEWRIFYQESIPSF